MSNIFKNYTGMRFNDFVNNVRVERAKSFLLESDLNIAECLLKIFQVINDIFVGGKKNN